MTTRRTLLTILAGVFIALGARADGPFFTGLGDLPGGHFYSEAEAISADGSVVVGRSTGASGNEEAFRWTLAGGIEDIGDLPGGIVRSQARGVSPDGTTIVGWSYYYANWAVQAFRWTEDTGMTGLGFFPGENNGFAFDVAADTTTIVGRTVSPGGIVNAVRWTDAGEPEHLGVLPIGEDGCVAVAVSSDGSIVVGMCFAHPNTREAFVWTAPDGPMLGLGDLPSGAFYSEATDISADGSTIVGSGTDGNGGAACRWVWDGSQWVIQALGAGGGASAVSGDGSVIVGANSIWDETHGVRDLATVLADDYGLGGAMAGWELYANDISEDGRTIVGTGKNPQGDTEGWIAHLGSACAADCDGSGDLSLFDFLCFVNQFNAGDAGADCDANGTLDLFDFLCFVNAFNAGC